MVATVPTPLDQADSLVAQLEDKQRVHAQRRAELEDERSRLALASVTGDDKAKARVTRLNAELAALAQETATLEAAIHEAQTRVTTAATSEYRQRNGAKAIAMRAAAAKFKEQCEELHAALCDVPGILIEMQDTLNEMRALGLTAPNETQFRVNCTLAIKSVLQQGLPQVWHRDILRDLLDSTQKTTMLKIGDAWSDMIERQCVRLFESDQEAA